MPSNRLKTLLIGFQNSKILVIGESILDSYLIGHTDRLCREAPVPIVDIDAQEDVPGGAAHTAANVAALGGEAIFLSILGNDPAASTLRERLEVHRVNTDHLLCDPAYRTLVKQRIAANDQILLRCDRGSTDPIPAQLERSLIEKMEMLAPQCDAILVSDYAYGVMTPAVVKALAHIRQQSDGVLAVDSKRLPLFRQCRPTLVKPSYRQALAMLRLDALRGEERVAQMKAHHSQLLQKTGAQIVAVTLDRDGAVIFETEQEAYWTPAEPADHANAVGAGDTYISAFTLALAGHASMQDAADLAAHAGRVVVKEQGTTPCTWETLLAHLLEQPERQIGKQVNRHLLAACVAHYRGQNKRIVFTNGCFDILHAGHAHYLAQAKALGDILIVGVNTDASVSKLKGPERPINSLIDRLEVLAALESVDHVVAFDEETPAELIKIVQPDVFVKGGDYTEETLPEAPLVRELGGEISILAYVQNRSTTQIIETIRHSSAKSNSKGALLTLPLSRAAPNGTVPGRNRP